MTWWRLLSAAMLNWIRSTSKFWRWIIALWMPLDFNRTTLQHDLGFLTRRLTMKLHYLMLLQSLLFLTRWLVGKLAFWNQIWWLNPSMEQQLMTCLQRFSKWENIVSWTHPRWDWIVTSLMTGLTTLFTVLVLPLLITSVELNWQNSKSTSV